jgi:beta-galactosidase
MEQSQRAEPESILSVLGTISLATRLYSLRLFMSCPRHKPRELKKYVSNGGVFVTNFRLAAKTESSQMVRTALPGPLRELMGVTVEDYVPIYSGTQGVKFSSALSGPDGECGIWADILVPSTAEVLGTYTTGQNAGRAAVTINSFGKGKAVYLGADLTGASLSRVLQALSAMAKVQQPLDVPPGVELTVRRSAAKEWVFLLNHTADVQTIPVSKVFTDLVTGEKQAGEVQLNAYAVRVLQAS